MGRAKLKSKSKSPKPTKESIAPKNKSVHAPSDGYRAVTWVATAGIVGAMVCLFVFYQSDIREKIVSSHFSEARAYAETTKTPIVNSTPDGPQDDSEDGTVTDLPGTTDPDKTDDGNDSVPSGSTIINITPGSVIDREELAGHLSEMDTAEFTALAETIDMIIWKNPSSVNLPERKSLAEAYAEAESRYPGQIDGSKRLKLVDELNAIDYKYYVAEDGDTLLELSKVFDIPLGQLVETNGIHHADRINAGAILLLPSETVQPE